MASRQLVAQVIGKAGIRRTCFELPYKRKQVLFPKQYTSCCRFKTVGLLHDHPKCHSFFEQSSVTARLLHETHNSPQQDTQLESKSKSIKRVKRDIISSGQLTWDYQPPNVHRPNKIQTGTFTTSSSMQKLQKNFGKDRIIPGGLSFEFFSLRSLISTPSNFMAYGLGGLIPFMSVPAYMQWTGTFCPVLAHIQLVYGACILSFLGGVSWGHQLHKGDKASLSDLGYSITLPLIAWPGVLLYPNVASFLVVTAGIVYAGLMDTRNQSHYPNWFKNLRFLLSSLVSLSLLTTMVFSYTKDTTKNKKESIER